MGDRLSAAGVRYSAAGENIALNVSVRAAHESLMASPGHRANLLGAEFTHIGVGIVETGGEVLVTQSFIEPGPGFVASLPERRSPAEPDDRGVPTDAGFSTAPEPTETGPATAALAQPWGAGLVRVAPMGPFVTVWRTPPVGVWVWLSRRIWRSGPMQASQFW